MRLNRIVVENLLKFGIPAISVSPLAAATTTCYGQIVASGQCLIFNFDHSVFYFQFLFIFTIKNDKLNSSFDQTKQFNHEKSKVAFGIATTEARSPGRQCSEPSKKPSGYPIPLVDQCLVRSDRPRSKFTY